MTGKQLSVTIGGKRHDGTSYVQDSLVHVQ
jgi:hypothetical protein